MPRARTHTHTYQNIRMHIDIVTVFLKMFTPEPGHLKCLFIFMLVAHLVSWFYVYICIMYIYVYHVLVEKEVVMTMHYNYGIL